MKISYSRKEFHRGDKIFRWLLRGLAFSVFGVILLLTLQLILGSLPILQIQGLKFLTNPLWNPVTKDFGALAVIYGTFLTSFIALILAVPVSLGVALFLTELAPPFFARMLSFLIEMLAAVPSVIFGLWGIFELCPWLQDHVQPFLQRFFGFIPFFKGPAFGLGSLAAGLILAIMVIPTIASLCREVMATIPASTKEAALGLGATRWEMIRLTVLKGSFSGIISAIILGLGRAVGETMAVTMVIGNRADIKLSWFAPSQTMASLIANEYGEAVDKLHLSALIATGLTLLVCSLLVNGIARFILWNVQKKYSGGIHG